MIIRMYIFWWNWQGYRDDEGLCLESDADEQLLIYIPFTQVVKLHTMVVLGPEDGGEVVKFVELMSYFHIFLSVLFCFELLSNESLI